MPDNVKIGGASCQDMAAISHYHLANTLSLHTHTHTHTPDLLLSIPKFDIPKEYFHGALTPHVSEAHSMTMMIPLVSHSGSREIRWSHRVAITLRSPSALTDDER